MYIKMGISFMLPQLALLYFLLFLLGGGSEGPGVSNARSLCHGIEDAPGIPNKFPKKVAFKEQGHGKMLHGFRITVKELNATITHNLNEPNIDIYWETYYALDVPKSALALFGPEFGNVFPSPPDGGAKVAKYTGSNIYYTTMCVWNTHVFAELGGMKWPMIGYPFAVDVDRFSNPVPIEQRDKVFLMTKLRHPDLVKEVKDLLDRRGIKYKLFDYQERYVENDYLEYLKNAKYGIWIGKHESQGFGMQEAYSMGVPLLVYDSTSMRDEYYWDDVKTKNKLICTFCSSFPNVGLNATTVSTRSALLGEIVYSIKEMDQIWDHFENNVKNKMYNPRKVIIDVLSPKASAVRLLRLYEYHREKWCEQYIDIQAGRTPKNYYTTINSEAIDLVDVFN